MLRGAVWEELNSRDLRNPDLVSSLSTCNDEYYRAIREKHKASESLHDGSGSGNRESREEHHQKQLKDMKKAMDAALKTRQQKEEEERVVSDSYLPAVVVSACLRAICSSYESEENLVVYMEALFKTAYNRNLREGDRPTQNKDSSSGKEDYKKAMPSRPKKIDYVQVCDVVDFSEEPDIRRVLQVEHRKASKIMGPYMHKNKARDSL